MLENNGRCFTHENKILKNAQLVACLKGGEREKKIEKERDKRQTNTVEIKSGHFKTTLSSTNASIKYILPFLSVTE